MEDQIAKYELWIGEAGELDVWWTGLNDLQTPKKKKKNRNYLH